MVKLDIGTYMDGIGWPFATNNEYIVRQKNRGNKAPALLALIIGQAGVKMQPSGNFPHMQTRTVYDFQQYSWEL